MGNRTIRIGDTGTVDAHTVYMGDPVIKADTSGETLLFTLLYDRNCRAVAASYDGSGKMTGVFFADVQELENSSGAVDTGIAIEENSVYKIFLLSDDANYTPSQLLLWDSSEG